MVTFIVHNFVYGAKPEKSVYAYLADLARVPCPLKITLQWSADKKVWEPLV